MQCLPPDELIRRPSPLPDWWDDPIDWKQAGINEHRQYRKGIGRHDRAKGELQSLAFNFVARRKKNGGWVGTGEIARALGLPGSSYLARSLNSLVTRGKLERRTVKRRGITHEYKAVK